VRFYKGADNTGPHTGSLWTADGTLLATATFVNETGSGWQTVVFDTAITISADTTYIVSYHTNGFYSATSNYFLTAHANGSLTALDSLSSGGNGVFSYGSSTLFPDQSFNATNYWVDVLYNQTNVGPTAVADTGSAQEDGGPVILTAASLLANDTDPDAGDTKTLVSVNGTGTVGTVSINGAGNVVYDPGSAFQSLAAGATATDTFAYTMRDSAGAQSTATVTMTITGVNDAPTAGTVADQSTSEDTPLTVAKALILAAASDVDGDTLTITGGSALHGTVSFDVDGNLVYTPNANANGPDVVTYTLSDGHGGTATGTFNVGIGAVNDDPIVGTVADQNTSEDTPLTVLKALILAAASDVDGDTLSIIGGSALHGTVSFDVDGNLVYTPNANANGADVVTYTLSDGHGGTATGTFNVGVGAVNDDPIAGTVADQSTSEDTPLTVSKAMILAAASDVDGDTLTITGGSALHGTVSFDVDGNLVYTPNANANGADVVTYTLSDGHGGTATGTFNIGVGAVNDAPTAGSVADQSTSEDTPLTVSKALILAAASDVDGDTLSITGGSALHGTISFDVDGNLVYTPNANANGPDVVTYTLSDGHGGTATGSFNVGVTSVDDPGVAQSDAFATNEALVITTGNVFADNGSGADSDLDSALAVAAVNGSAAAVGVMITLASGAHLTLNADGTFIYDPNHAFDHLPGASSGATGLTGTDSFTYTLAGGGTATVTVTVSGLDSDDTLVGTAGDDTLTGGIGADHIDGLAGNDTASYAGSAAGVTVKLTSGTGTGGDAQGDTLVSIESLTGSALDDNLTGSAGANTLDGGAGNDILEGRGGADVLIGGAGIDTAYYTASSAGVTVDLVLGTGAGGDAQGDTLSGIEQIYGSNLADTLIGDGGANALWGSGGNDILRGGLGADVLKGGAGNDSFVYTGLSDSTVAASGRDLIADFTSGDRIDLSGIDADGNAANGDTAFSFGFGGFTGHAGELRVVVFADGRQGIYLDANGDRNPDSIIMVLADHALNATDFVL
uniref:cadherin-like domain-containing protein n=1 Tax=Inquilinus sp. TaxID=1932117 RepID=UPI0031E3EFB4